MHLGFDTVENVSTAEQGLKIFEDMSDHFSSLPYDVSLVCKNTLYPPHGQNQNRGFGFWFQFPFFLPVSLFPAGFQRESGFNFRKSGFSF